MAKHDRSGIYAIEHIESKRFYIGSSAAFYKRKQAHVWKLRAGIHHSTHLQNAWNKYGEDAFEFYLLEECDKENLLIREQAYLDAFRPVFNVCWVAGRVTSPEMNARRAATLRARAALITNCPKGHAYDAANTYINKKGKRICRQCNAERVAQVYANETPEQYSQRQERVLAYHTQNREKRLAAMRIYVATHKEQKRAYDRARRLAHAAKSAAVRDSVSPDS